MRSIKFAAIFAAFGFLISFVFGIFSHLSFLSVILKAFLFAFIFCLLGFLISMLSTKFLFEDSGSEFGTDSSTLGVEKLSTNTKGNYVDITIRDEDLPQSLSGNHYVVGENHQLLNESDFGKQNNVEVKTVNEVEADKNVSFAPIRLEETSTNVSSKEAIKPDLKNETGFHDIEIKKDNINQNNSEKDIDTLPELNGFNVSKPEETDSSDSEDVEEDSGYSASSIQSSRSSEEVLEIKDASLYAKAISSVLSGESE